MEVQSRFLLILVLALSLTACSGEISSPQGTANNDDGAGPDASSDMPGGGDTDNPNPECAGITVGEQPLRRLSSEQYHNVIRDLLPADVVVQIEPLMVFPETQIDSGFANDAQANTVSRAESNRIEDNAEIIGTWLIDNAETAIPAVMPCVSPGFVAADINSCMDSFIDSFGLRAWRRPLTDSEKQMVRELYDEMQGYQGSRVAWAAVMQFFLESPALLYRIERGAEPVEGAEGLVHLTDWEMASRLSFFFLNSMPDQELLSAAEAGELSTRDQIEEQARRLVNSPRAIDTMAVFHRDWLRVYQIEDAVKGSASFNESVRQAMLGETRAFVDHVVNDADGTLNTLLTTNEMPVAPELADIYGTSAGVGPVPNRHGILTQASVMAAHAKEEVTHPIERGAFFMREFMCGYIPPFPGNVDTTGPLQNTSNLPTARERLSPLLEREDCSGCHQLFNPLGYGLENYDALGRWRDSENGATIDASGTLNIGDASGEFSTPGELIGTAAQSEQMHGCYASQWFRFTFGRSEEPEDVCTIQSLRDDFIASGGDIKELLVQIALSDAFLYRNAAQ